jgi:hypothetical protein
MPQGYDVPVAASLCCHDNDNSCDCLSQKANEFFVVLGAIGLVVYAVLASGLVKFPEMKLLSFAFLLSAIGSLLIVSAV